jgi:ubiquinone/menaquinone biosynthesis C-methylase UbiE
MKPVIKDDYNDQNTSLYDQQSEKMNVNSISDLKRAIDGVIILPGRSIDLGCGAGDLVTYLQSKGLESCGIDISSEMIDLAKKYITADIRVEDFAEKTSFEDKSFDLIVSKWAFQANEMIDSIYGECARLLKSGGHLVFLSKHPFRQFLEKKKQGKNYFTKETVHSNIFSGSITVHEPSHTMSEYFSNYFLQNFSVTSFQEGYEFPGAEQIGGDTYPTYFIVVAQKK